MTKVAIITGSAGGIGRELCQTFDAEGYQVIGIDKSVSETKWPSVEFDLSNLVNNSKAKSKLKSEIQKHSREISLVVNNAAVQVVKAVEEVTVEDWQDSLNVNLLAPFLLVQSFVNELRAAKGSVINISSIHEKLSKKDFSVYATTKGALSTMTRSLALDLAPDIRVNAISPAATETEMLRAGFADNPEAKQELKDFHPLGRIATPKEIAESAVFLASEKAAFITGSILEVNGGIASCLYDPA